MGRHVDCRFVVREMVATCPCGWELDFAGTKEFNEVEYPLTPGSVVECAACHRKVRITNPGRLFDRKLRGKYE